MEWHDIADPDGHELDELSQRYKLHSLHVEDARSLGQRAKAEVEDHYFFIVLKVLVLEENNKLTIGNLNLFVGSEFLITVHRTPLPTIESLRRAKHDLRPDEVLYRLMDGIVDSYLPLLDEVEARIDCLLDAIEGERDRLGGVVDLYLSSVANRNTDAMRTQF